MIEGEPYPGLELATSLGFEARQETEVRNVRSGGRFALGGAASYAFNRWIMAMLELEVLSEIREPFAGDTTPVELRFGARGVPVLDQLRAMGAFENTLIFFVAEVVISRSQLLHPIHSTTPVADELPIRILAMMAGAVFRTPTVSQVGNTPGGGGSGKMQRKQGPSPGRMLNIMPEVPTTPA